MGQTVDILTQSLLQLAAALIMALGTLAIARLTRWLGIQGDSAARAAFDDVLNKAVTFGLQQSQQLIKQRGWDDAVVKSQALQLAAPYVQNFPDVLKALKIDKLDQAHLNAAILNALDRAFPAAAAAAAASPATPPPTAPVPERQADLPALAAAIDGA